MLELTPLILTLSIYKVSATKAKHMTTTITEMNALDDHPFSTVEDKGFCRLIDQFLSDSKFLNHNVYLYTHAELVTQALTESYSEYTQAGHEVTFAQ